jgi:hypothetical protein
MRPGSLLFPRRIGASRAASLSWKGTLVRRLSILLLTLPLLLLFTACSDDGGSQAVATTGASATTTLEAPAAGLIEGSVRVDFTGAPQELQPMDLAFEVAAGSTAWDAIMDAIGEDNMSYQDFGGDLGIFITGFHGVQAKGNHFWEFKLNGETAGAGVSAYEVQPGDVLEFVYSSF